MRGRKPAVKPALNVVEGGFVAAVDIPEPKWLLPYPKDWGKAQAKLASEQWVIITAYERSRGTLSPENAGDIEIYCFAWARWRLAEAHIAEHSPIVEAPRTGNPIPNPMLRVAREASETAHRISAAYGWPPTLRGRVTKANASKKQSKPADKYLGRASA